MSLNEEYDETIQELIELFDREIGKHYEEYFIAGLERGKEIIKEYFELID